MPFLMSYQKNAPTLQKGVVTCRLSLRMPDGSLSPQAFSPTPQPNPAAAAAAQTLSLLNRDHDASLQLIWQQQRPPGSLGAVSKHIFWRTLLDVTCVPAQAFQQLQISRA